MTDEEIDAAGRLVATFASFQNWEAVECVLATVFE